MVANDNQGILSFVRDPDGNEIEASFRDGAGVTT